MNFSINTNLSAMNALDVLNNTSGSLQTSMTRLSTGLKINSASDDPSGLIRSQNMSAQISGLGQASANTQDGINMLKTADGAMAQISNLLQSIRALAVSSANTAVVDASTLQANQTQIDSVIQSINNIASTTQFGTKKLLDGTAGVQAGLTDITDVSSMYLSGNFGGASVQSGPITLQSVSSATEASLTLGKTFAAATSTVPAGNFQINGYSFSADGTSSLQSLVTQINAASATTGVTASITGTAGSYQVQLNQSQYGSQFGINLVDPSKIMSTTSTASSTGTDAVFDVTLTTNQGTKTAVFTGGRGPGTSGLRLSDADGNIINLTQTGNLAFSSAASIGSATANQVQFQIGAYANQSVNFALPTMFAANIGADAVPGQSISSLNVTTQQGADQAMQIIDSAINQVSVMRGQLGAFQQDFLQSNVTQIATATQNLTASKSQITDTNMASEISNFTQLQILQQSGVTVLSQANQLPQQILTLLKNT